MYINGKWVENTKTLEIKNPATGEVVDTVQTVGAKETLEAIDAATAAFPAWSKLPAEQRSAYMHKVVEKLEEKKEYLAEIITKEMGKSIFNARYEVGSTIAFFKWYAEEARRIYGDVIPSSAENTRIQVVKQAVGVVAAITPWNFPMSMGARKLGPALAAGCTIVLKPSSVAPLSSLELFKIFDEVGFPKGVVNLVIGSSGPIAETLMASADVRKISFTGSTEVGKKLIRQSADTVKRVSMELGGHAPFIIFEDADLDIAVAGLIKSKFGSTGQQCICTNRVYVHETVYEEFAQKFLKATNEINVGNGLDENNQMGPLVNEKAIEKVHAQVENALEHGAELLCGGKRLVDGEHTNGFFYAPTILKDVTEKMDIVFEETFGPVAPLIPFSNEQEVVEKANNINYGLASYFYTNDLSRAHRVSEALEYGIVGVNDPAPFAVQASFGGFKESGLGREGGKFGMEDYIEVKTISTVFKGL